MGGEVSDDAIIQLIDRMGVDHTKGIDFQVFKRILMLFPSRYQALARLCIRSCDVVGVADKHTAIHHRTISIHNVFDYWFRQIIDTGSPDCCFASPVCRPTCTSTD
jgi:hypothetical protein